MTPIPPRRPIAIARRASVTVSIAALTNGDRQRDPAAEPGARVYVGGEHLRIARLEQYIVEGERFGRQPGRHFTACGPERPAWESALEEMGNPIVRADAGRFPHRMAARPGFTAAWQHFLYFLPLPHGHGSFRPTFRCPLRTSTRRPPRGGAGASAGGGAG